MGSSRPGRARPRCSSAHIIRATSWGSARGRSHRSRSRLGPRAGSRNGRRAGGPAAPRHTPALHVRVCGIRATPARRSRGSPKPKDKQMVASATLWRRRVRQGAKWAKLQGIFWRCAPHLHPSGSSSPRDESVSCGSTRPAVARPDARSSALRKRPGASWAVPLVVHAGRLTLDWSRLLSAVNSRARQGHGVGSLKS